MFLRGYRRFRKLSFYQLNTNQAAAANITPFAASWKTGVSLLHTLSDVSPRLYAELEHQLWSSVGSKAIDPIVGKDLRSLKWIDRRMELAEGGKTLKMVLRLPTLLHPSKEELRKTVQEIAAKEVAQWLIRQRLDLNVNVTVEVVGTKPVPTMARFVENQEELVKQLGPGLVNVAQYLAVYR